MTIVPIEKIQHDNNIGYSYDRGSDGAILS